MKFFITGTTSGLGLSLQQQLQESSNEIVVLNRKKLGIENISEIQISDLKNTTEIVSSLSNNLSVIEDVDVCILNAGTLGQIENAVDINSSNLLDSFQINCLSNKVIVDFLLKNSKCSRFIYISSGAASSPYTGWLEYCSTKAFSDMMFRVYAKEISDKIFVSVSPGAIATKMQKQIRDSSVEEHPDMKKFFDLHDNNMLRDPSDAADKLLCRIDELKIDDSGSFIKI